MDEEWVISNLVEPQLDEVRRVDEVATAQLLFSGLKMEWRRWSGPVLPRRPGAFTPPSNLSPPQLRRYPSGPTAINTYDLIATYVVLIIKDGAVIRTRPTIELALKIRALGVVLIRAHRHSRRQNPVRLSARPVTTFLARRVAVRGLRSARPVAESRAALNRKRVRFMPLP